MPPERYLAIRTRLRLIDDLDHLIDLIAYCRPAAGRQNHNGDASPSEVLLVLQIFFACHHDLKASLFGGIQWVTVLALCE